MSFVVEDNVPITKKAVSRQRSPLREALADLEIGQCVTVFPEEGQSMKNLRARLSGMIQGAKMDTPGAAYINRTVEAQDPKEGEGAPEREAIRIWRVHPEDAPKPAAKKKAAKKKAAAKADDRQQELDLEPSQAEEGVLPRGQEASLGAYPTDPEPAAPEDGHSHDEDDPFGGAFDEGEEAEDPDAEEDGTEGEEEDPFGWDPEDEADLERPAQRPNL
jgi:hypothetical protein